MNKKIMTRYYLKISNATQIKDKKDRMLYRFLEILPGLSAWLTLILLTFFSWYAPFWVSIFIIIFDVFFIAKNMYFSAHLKPSFNQMRKNMKINWLDKLNKLEREREGKDISDAVKVKSWSDLYHLVIFPMYKEPYEIVRESFVALANSNYPLDKFIVVLATEERAGDIGKETASKIKEEFSSVFTLLATIHPANIEGETKGKGSNSAWAARKAQELIDAKGISYEKIVISSFDIDTQVYPEYFGVLTYSYLNAKNPFKSSFQPVALYLNHIWEAPSLARVLSFSSSFWQIIQQERPERMATFSSHSMSFKTLIEVGFWQTDVVSEDSRIYWQSLLHYDGDYIVQPLYYPVSMDANVASSFWKTIVNQYKQRRRWAYGCENVPYAIFGTIKSKMRLSKKMFYILHTFEDYYSWSVYSLIVFFFGWAPVILGGHKFHSTVLSYNLPVITRDLMTLATVGLITSVYLSLRLMPPRPAEYGKHKYIFLVLEWIMVPFTLNIFGSIPAMDSQTRLMLGKYMDFWVTEKTRLKSDNNIKK